MEQVESNEMVISEESQAREEREATLSRPALTFDETIERLIYLGIGALAIGIVFWRLQFSTPAICCGDFDGYYHIKWSQMLWQEIREHHFPPTFTWLPLTTLNPRDYVDHHLLFHIIQIPFTWFHDVRLGAKFSATLFGSLAVLSCYWLIVRQRVRYPLVWLVALLGCSAPFLYRMNMTKAMSVSIVLLVAGIYLLFERKYLWLLPLAFVFTLTYDMFVLLGLSAAVWTAIILWSERRVEWRPLLWVAIGIIAGFVINPYFPHNARLFYEHVMIKVTAKDFTTKVGNEWYPYESWDFLGNCAVAFISMVAGYIAFDWTDRERAKRPLFFLIFSTILMIANFRWRRFAEYWPPFAVLFAAFSMQLVFDGVRTAITSRLPSGFLDDLQPYLDRHDRPDVERERRKARWAELESALVALILGASIFVLAIAPRMSLPAKGAIIIVAYMVLASLYFKLRGVGTTVLATVTLALVISMLFNVRAEMKEIGTTAPHADYSKGMAWARSNVPAGQVIFNTDWDDFPKLFYYDASHAYVSGLDPTYLLDASPDLAKLYEKITLGKEKDPGPIIRDRFGARYVFTDNEHEDFYNQALDSGWFDEVYADDTCTILHIRDQKGEPPPDTADDSNDSDHQDDNSSDDEDNLDDEAP